MYIIFLIVSITMAVLAQLLFKSFSLSQTYDAPNILRYVWNFKLFLGVFLYSMSAGLYIISLKKIPLSIAYPTISVSYVAVIALSGYFFGETISIYKLLGSGLILSGVVLFWL